MGCQGQDPSPGGAWPPPSPLGEGSFLAGARPLPNLFPSPRGEGGRGTRLGEGALARRFFAPLREIVFHRLSGFARE